MPPQLCITNVEYAERYAGWHVSWTTRDGQLHTGIVVGYWNGIAGWILIEADDNADNAFDASSGRDYHTLLHPCKSYMARDAYFLTLQAPPSHIKCECGAEKCRTTHSRWCPKSTK